MRNFLRCITIGALMAFSCPAFSADTPNTEMVKPAPGIANWTLDQNNSTAIFHVNHSSLLDLYGYIPGSGMTGSAEINDTDFTKSKFEVTFKATSLVQTFNFPYDVFKTEAGGLEASKCPEIKFVSKKITKKGNQYLMTGALTMHGISRDATVEIENASDICLYDGVKYRAFQGKAVINRQDFGITWREPEKLNQPIFADKVTITMIIELTNPALGAQGPATK
jgi:polyisoprenoid-binding protein YceI